VGKHVEAWQSWLSSKWALAAAGIVTLAGLAYLIGLGTAGGAVQNPSMEDIDLAWGESSSSTELYVNATVHNPNPFSIPLTHATFEAHVGDTQIGTGALVASPTLPAGNATRLPLRVELDHQSLQDWWRLHVRSGETSTLSLSTTLEVSGVSVPVPVEVTKTFRSDLTGRLSQKMETCEGDSQPCISGASLRWETPSSQPPELVVELTVRNPTDTGLEVDHVQGTLELSGEPIGKLAHSKAESIPPHGQGTMTLRVGINEDGLLAWWPDHVDRCEESPARVSLDLTASPGSGSQAQLDARLGRIETHVACGSGPLFTMQDTSFQALVPEPPTPRTITSQWGTVSRGETTVESTLTFHNTNPFPFQTTRTDFSLQSHGTELVHGTIQPVESPAKATADADLTSTAKTQTIIHDWWPEHIRGEERSRFTLTVGEVSASHPVETNLLQRADEALDEANNDPPKVACPHYHPDKQRRDGEVRRHAFHFPCARADELSWGRVTEDTTTVTARIKTFNPNGYPVQVSDMELGLELNGIEVGTGRIQESKRLPAESSRWISVEVTIDHANLVEWWPTHVNGDCEESRIGVRFDARFTSGQGDGSWAVTVENGTFPTPVFCNDAKFRTVDLTDSQS
jgi:LEA14-like dessication related protein